MRLRYFFRVPLVFQNWLFSSRHRYSAPGPCSSIFAWNHSALRKYQSPAVEAEFAAEVPDEIARRRVVTIFAWIAGFIFSVYLIGFPGTVPLFLFLYLFFEARMSWIFSLTLMAITWGFFYLLFQRLIHLQFEAGAIQSWLGM